jgi:hypothetical protein
LIYCQPDGGFVNGRVHIFSDQSGDVSDALLPVAVLPDQRGGLVQAMGLVTFEVVDQHFIGDFSRDQIELSCLRLSIL